MCLIVEYRLSGDRLKITAVAESVPEMWLTIERWRLDGDDRLHLFVLAQGERFERLEAAFEARPNCVGVDAVSANETSRLYRVTVVSRADNFPEYGRVNGIVTDARIESDGLYVSGYLADQSELAEVKELLHSEGFEVEVVTLETLSNGSHTRLSDEQIEAVTTAYEMGYFEVPRDVTQEAVADELGISAPALSERLKRAQKRLVRRHLFSDRLIDGLV